MDMHEKVIKGLECISGTFPPCKECPYSLYMYSFCRTRCAEDALALLKAQEPRVMTLEEVQRLKDHEDYAWIEWREDKENIMGCLRVYCHSWRVYYADNAIGFETPFDIVSFVWKDYGKTWRCWTSRPTDAQLEATPWQ